jgi:hypothetical protein
MSPPERLRGVSGAGTYGYGIRGPGSAEECTEGRPSQRITTLCAIRGGVVETAIALEKLLDFHASL